MGQSLHVTKIAGAISLILLDAYRTVHQVSVNEGSTVALLGGRAGCATIDVHVMT